MQLEKEKAEFARRGLNVATVSYDSPEVLDAFAKRVGITYPMLADPQSKMIRDFGILNETIPAGTFAHGVPYPGTYIVDAAGEVRQKFFERDYRERYTAASMLVRSVPPDTLGGWGSVETKHLKLRYRASDSEVRGGSTATLSLEVELKPGMHVYAPGVTGYMPVKWSVEPSAGANAFDPQWPASHMLRLEAIRETVPVYEGKFVVHRDITFLQQKELLAAAGEASRVKIAGSFQYQACDASVCYLPVTVPLPFEFGVAQHDRTRAPEQLRRK